jgi:hypothetical protein
VCVVCVCWYVRRQACDHTGFPPAMITGLAPHTPTHTQRTHALFRSLSLSLTHNCSSRLSEGTPMSCKVASSCLHETMYIQPMVDTILQDKIYTYIYIHLKCPVEVNLLAIKAMAIATRFTKKARAICLTHTHTHYAHRHTHTYPHTHTNTHIQT